MATERIKLTPDRLYIKRSNANIAFDTNNRYIKTSSPGSFAINPQNGGPVMWVSTPAFENPWFPDSVSGSTSNFGACIGGCSLRSALYSGSSYTARFPEFDGNLVVMLGASFVEAYNSQYATRKYVHSTIYVNEVAVGSVAGVCGRSDSSLSYNRGFGSWLTNPTSGRRYVEFSNVPAGASIRIGPTYIANGSLTVGATFTATGTTANDTSLLATGTAYAEYRNSLDRMSISLHAYRPAALSLPLELTP